MRALADNCSGLKELRLKEIKNMQDEFVTSLKSLEDNLTSLDLSTPGASLTEEALIGLMEVVGPTLTHLDLSGHDLVTDNFLHEGIKLHALTLRSLALSQLPELTNEGVSEFFSTWTTASKHGTANPPLVSIDLSRNHQLSTEALNALLAHSGYALQHLKINSWKSTSAEALTQIAKAAKTLRTLDVGWCREMNDSVVKELMTECEVLKEVKAWGCNGLTEFCPRKVTLCFQCPFDRWTDMKTTEGSQYLRN
jgi:DNA repair protein RAD7